MNRHHAVEIEDLSASEPHLPGRDRDSMTPDRNAAVQPGEGPLHWRWRPPVHVVALCKN
jgi:hypothetical protein